VSVLFSGSRTFQSGLRESATIPVPGNIKQAGVPLRVRVSLEAENFPNGTTTISVLISTDGGATFNEAAMTVVMPATFRGPAPHYWYLEYQLGADDDSTHAKYRTNAPAGFTTNVTVEAT
jgi:hypothetical protein